MKNATWLLLHDNAEVNRIWKLEATIWSTDFVYKWCQGSEREWDLPESHSEYFSKNQNRGILQENFHCTMALPMHPTGYVHAFFLCVSWILY